VELVRSNYQDSVEPFKDTCEHLLKYYYEQQWSRNQELITLPNSSSRRAQVTKVEDIESEEEPGEDRMAAYGKQSNEGLRVTDMWWKAATPEEQDILKKMRTRIKARIQSTNEFQGNGRTNLNHSATEEKAIKAHAQRAVATRDPEEDDSDDDSAVAQMHDIETRMRDMFGGMARMEESDQVRCHLEYCIRDCRLWSRYQCSRSRVVNCSYRPYQDGELGRF
jgi:hypothetical protein